MLGRSLDELPPQTRRLLLLIDEMVERANASGCRWSATDYRFSRRDVRQFTGWGDTQLKMHLHRLEELEYLLVHRGGRGQSFVYELVFERQGDAEQARAARPDRDREAQNCAATTERSRGARRRDVAGSSRPPRSAGCRGVRAGEESPDNTYRLPSRFCAESAKKSLSRA